MNVKAIVFDWGDTLMRDFPFPGAMKDWPVISVIPQAAKVLAELRNSYVLAVGSNAGDSSSRDIKEALDRGGIGHSLHHVFSSKDIGYEKPHLKFFQFIQEQLQLQPWEILMVGNNCLKDIQGPKQAGWRTVWFNENNETTTECGEADATIFHLSALPHLLINEMDHE
jgi:putative hydrolase of the HAD superfamily